MLLILVVVVVVVTVPIIVYLVRSIGVVSWAWYIYIHTDRYGVEFDNSMPCLVPGTSPAGYLYSSSLTLFYLVWVCVCACYVFLSVLCCLLIPHHHISCGGGTTFFFFSLLPLFFSLFQRIYTAIQQYLDCGTRINSVHVVPVVFHLLFLGSGFYCFFLSRISAFYSAGQPKTPVASSLLRMFPVNFARASSISFPFFPSPSAVVVYFFEAANQFSVEGSK